MVRGRGRCHTPSIPSAVMKTAKLDGPGGAELVAATRPQILFAEHLHDGWARARSILLALFAAGFEEGSLPFARSHPFSTVSDPGDLIPVGGRVERSVTSRGRADMLLVSGKGWLALIETEGMNSSRITVTAAEASRCDAIVSGLLARAPAPDSSDDSMRSVDLRCATGGSSTLSLCRHVACPAWTDIARNYPRSTHDPLAT